MIGRACCTRGASTRSVGGGGAGTVMRGAGGGSALAVTRTGVAGGSAGVWLNSYVMRAAKRAGALRPLSRAEESDGIDDGVVEGEATRSGAERDVYT